MITVKRDNLSRQWFRIYSNGEDIGAVREGSIAVVGRYASTGIISVILSRPTRSEAEKAINKGMWKDVTDIEYITGG